MQGITEAVGKCYCSNGDSFEGVFIASEYQDGFEMLANEAMEYYAD